jgi:hypothetical protein
VGEQIDEYAGGHLFQCKRWLNQGRSFRTRVQSMRRIMKHLYFNGTGSDRSRKSAIMLAVAQLEEMMIEDFTTCLRLPPQQCA